MCLCTFFLDGTVLSYIKRKGVVACTMTSHQGAIEAVWFYSHLPVCLLTTTRASDKKNKIKYL